MAGNKYNVTFDPRPKTWRELFFLTDEERAELEKQRQFDLQAQQDAINSMNPEAQARQELAREDQQIAWAREDQLNDDRLAKEAIEAQRRADAEYLRTGRLPNNPIDAQRLASAAGQADAPITTDIPQDVGPILAVPSAIPRGVGPLRIDENTVQNVPPITESRDVSARPAVGVPTDPTTTNSTATNTSPVKEQTQTPQSGPVLKTDEPQKKGIADTVWGWLGVTDPEERKEIAWSMLSGAGANIAAAAEGYNGWGAFGKGLEATGKARGENFQNLTDRAKTTAAIEAHKLKNAADARAQAYQQRMAQIIADGRGRGDAGLTAEQLFELAAVATAGGDMETARKAMEYGQQLQQAIAKDGQYIDKNGVVQNAPGSVAANAELEAGKSAGRKAGEAPFESTSDLRELDRVNQERARNGQAPISAEDWIRQSQATKSTKPTADETFSSEAAKTQAKSFDTVQTNGFTAQKTIGQVNELEKALATAPGGFLGAFQQFAINNGVKVGENASQLEYAQALINQLIPAQRPAGSGAMSDGDVAMFRASVPNLINTPEGNRLIIGTMRAIAQYDVALGQIAGRALSGEISRAEANRLMMELGNPIDEFRRASASLTGGKTGNSIMGASVDGQVITNRNGKIYVKRQ